MSQHGRLLIPLAPTRLHAAGTRAYLAAALAASRRAADAAKARWRAMPIWIERERGLLLGEREHDDAAVFDPRASGNLL